MGEHADLKLVSRLLKGDQRAFDAFFASNYPRLYRFALARLGDDRPVENEASQHFTIVRLRFKGRQPSEPGLKSENAKKFCQSRANRV